MQQKFGTFIFQDEIVGPQNPWSWAQHGVNIVHPKIQARHNFRCNVIIGPWNYIWNYSSYIGPWKIGRAPQKEMTSSNYWFSEIFAVSFREGNGCTTSLVMICSAVASWSCGLLVCCDFFKSVGKFSIIHKLLHGIGIYTPRKKQ